MGNGILVLIHGNEGIDAENRLDRSGRDNSLAFIWVCSVPELGAQSQGQLPTSIFYFYIRECADQLPCTSSWS